MNFKIILSGLMALMLGLGMSGCAIKQDDTVVEKAGKQTLNTLGDGVAAVGGVAKAIASIPTGGLVLGLSSVNTERLEGTTKEDLDSNENLEFLTKSGSVSIYSGKGFKRGHFVYFSECGNGKPIVYKGDWMVASRLMLQDANNEGCDDYIVYYDKTHKPSSFDEDKFYDSLEEDRFGNKLWAGNDLILDIDNNKPSCIGCQEYIFRVKDARDTSDKAFYDYMDPLVYERLEDKYNDEVIYITEEALEKDDSYIPLIKSVNFSFYNKKGEPKDAYYVMDKRKGESSLVKLDDDDFYEFIKEYNLEGVYAIPGYGVCQMDYSEFDSDKFEEEVIDNPDARYFYDNTVLLKKVSAGAFNSKYNFFFTYPLGYSFRKTDNPCTKIEHEYQADNKKVQNIVISEDVKKEFYDNSPDYELLTVSNDIYFYSAKRLKEGEFLVFMECDNNKTVSIEADGAYITNQTSINKSVQCKDFAFASVFPIRSIDFEKFNSHTEKDKFGNNVWFGNDLIVCMDCKNYEGKVEYIKFYKNARNKYPDEHELSGVEKAFKKGGVFSIVK